MIALCARARSLRALATCIAVLAVSAGAGAGRAWASEAGTGWEAFAQLYPTYVQPGATATIQVFVENVGAKPSSGPIVVTDTLPAGVTATAAGGMHGTAVLTAAEEATQVIPPGEPRGEARWSCTGTGGETVTCTSNPKQLTLPKGSGLSFSEFERIGIVVQAQAGLSGSFVNHVTVSGGGGAGVAASADPLPVSAGEPEYGFSNVDVWSSNADGSLDTQAGSHPYETTFAVGFDELADGVTAGGEWRNVETLLAPGFFGEPNATPRCTREQINAYTCPPETQVGESTVLIDPGAGGSKPEIGPGAESSVPLYNIVPPPGVAAEFAFTIQGIDTFIDVGPRGYGGYPLVSHIDNIVEGYHIDGGIVTFWGDPEEASHDAGRHGPGCEGCSSATSGRPLLTLPTSCMGPQQFLQRGGGTWEQPSLSAEASVLSHNVLDEPLGFSGCSTLGFAPSLSTVPDSAQADAPAGLAVNVRMPQAALRTPGALVEATIKSTTVTLPEGLVINPGQAAGLLACSDAQAQLHEEGAPQCPLASKVGTVKIKTPLLEGEPESELEGDVFVLEQSRGAPGEAPNLRSHPPTLQLLITAEADGIHLKLVATVQLDERTGQLTTTLTETPGLPFTSFELAFSGGAQAALATPTRCGTYTTTSDFTPWTSPFTVDAHPASSFQITSGPGGGPCPAATLPFSPELIAGSTTDQAGGFTDFSLLLARGDGQQRIERLRFKAPEGLTGLLSDVSLCGEAQASEPQRYGECPQSSQIGHAAVASGPGPYSLVIPQPGNPESAIYLTGPYGGAPFGLSIVTHVIAGPFNLGTIVTRAKIEVDPITAQITVTTEPLPQIVDGVPSDLRLIDSVIDKPGFMINPTNCDPSSFSGTAWGAPPPGITEPHDEASISSRFQVGSCRSLQFKPSFTVSTSGKTSRADGASLGVKLSYPKAAQGTQANIAKVKVDLPKQLPSRLTTLQKACLAATFEANPADCPADSRVGQARAITPELPVPLEGPAYFVSHGGAKFPELIIVLQGYGVTLDLHGETFISKAGITSSTFATVPDAPVGSFELNLPQGPYSALAANGDPCKSTLKMRTAFVGQNGAEIHETTTISVTGCPKVKARKTKKTKQGKQSKQATKHS